MYNENEKSTGGYSTASVTKYYMFSGQRVATPALVTAGASVRKGDGVYYLHGDHLGSVSLTTDGAGGIVSQARNNVVYPEAHTYPSVLLGAEWTTPSAKSAGAAARP